MSRILSGERVLERAALKTRVALAAKALHAVGVAPGQSVALLLRNDFAFIEASVAAQLIGAYATPINWHNTPDEIGYVLRDCGAPVLVGHDDLLAGLGDAVPAGIAVLAVATPPEIAAAYGTAVGATLTGRRDWDEWLQAAADAPTPPPAPETGSMIYTSGTTGRPKGVKRRPTAEAERAARHANTERAYGLVEGEQTVVLMNGPMYHSAPNGYGLTAVRSGATIVLEPRFDAEEMLQLIERHRVSHMHMVPTMFTRLLRLPEATRRRYDLSSLRFVVHGAAPCPTRAETGDDRLVGSGDQRVLRLDRDRHPPSGIRRRRRCKSPAPSAARCPAARSPPTMPMAIVCPQTRSARFSCARAGWRTSPTTGATTSARRSAATAW